MGTSKTQPNEWMLHDGTGKSVIFADERGWVRRMADGQEIVIQCMTGITTHNSSKIISVANPPANDYSIGDGDLITFSVYFDENVNVNVNVTGDVPTITFDEAGVTQEAKYSSGSSANDYVIFTYTPAKVGVIDNVRPVINLNGGSIVSADDGTAIDPDFPDTYTQPTGVNVVA